MTRSFGISGFRRYSDIEGGLSLLKAYAVAKVMAVPITINHVQAKEVRKEIAGLRNNGQFH